MLDCSATLDSQKLSGPAASTEASVLRGGMDVVDRIATEWEQLCDESIINDPFCRPEWYLANVRAFEPGATLAIVTARNNGRLAAVLPLVEEWTLFCGVPVKKLRSPAPFHYGRFNVARSSNWTPDVCSALWQAVRDLDSWDLVEIRNVPAGEGIEQVAQTARQDGYRIGSWASIDSPYATLSGWNGDWDWWLRSRSRTFRKDMRRIHRELTSRGGVVLRKFVKADRSALETFYALESSGWKGHAGSAIVGQKTRSFYDEVTHNADRFGYLSLNLLEFQGRAIAGMLGLMYGSRFLGLKLAYDENFKHLAPGHLIVNAVLRDCAERGLNEFDFMGDDEEWKLKWTSQLRPHSWWYIFKPGPKGRFLDFLKFSVLPKGRSLLQGIQSRLHPNRGRSPHL